MPPPSTFSFSLIGVLWFWVIFIFIILEPMEGLPPDWFLKLWGLEKLPRRAYVWGFHYEDIPPTVKNIGDKTFWVCFIIWLTIEVCAFSILPFDILNEPIPQEIGIQVTFMILKCALGIGLGIQAFILGISMLLNHLRDWGLAS